LTATAFVTFSRIDVDLTVCDLCYLDRTALYYLTLLTSTTLRQLYYGNALSNDAKIIQIGLNTIIRATAYGDLELMR
jgi:hypothetical protein